MALIDILLHENNRETCVDDCVKLIDEQVASASGLSGLALKAAYSTLKGIRADYCAHVVDQLLPEISIALDPVWTEAVNNGNPVEYLTQRKAEVADELLQISDKRVEQSTKAVVKGVYAKLRPSAKNYVEKGIPDLAIIIDKHHSAA
jgi:transposase